MKNEPMEWGDFTSKVLTGFAKFLLLPCASIGIILLLAENTFGGVLLIGGLLLFLIAALVLLAFKPLLIKKYPEQREDKFVVDPEIPYEDLSPVQKIAVDQFEGNMVEACLYMLNHVDVEKQQEYSANFTPWEAAACIRAFDRIIEQKNLQEEFAKNMDLEYKLARLEMTESQVIAAQDNPFKKPLLCWLGGLLLSSVGGGLILGFGRHFLENYETIGLILCVASGLIATKTASLLIKCILFRKAKRLLQGTDQ